MKFCPTTKIWSVTICWRSYSTRRGLLGLAAFSRWDLEIPHRRSTSAPPSRLVERQRLRRCSYVGSSGRESNDRSAVNRDCRPRTLGCDHERLGFRRLTSPSRTASKASIDFDRKYQKPRFGSVDRIADQKHRERTRNKLVPRTWSDWACHSRIAKLHP